MFELYKSGEAKIVVYQTNTLNIREKRKQIKKGRERGSYNVINQELIVCINGKKGTKNENID